MTEPKKQHGGARPGAGRKPHQPTPEQRKTVEALSGYGVPMPEISAVVGVDEKTIRAHYQAELMQGRAKANAAVVKRLHEKAAKDGDTTALIWWTKSRMGWSEKQQVEHSGPDGGPIKHDVSLDPSEAYKRMLTPHG
ncbi:MAG: hypothetical protein RJA36_888 [Pseudomonadota bacterium]|jgi:hypothetical protein